MAYLVTGASGFVGKELVGKLVESGIKTYALVRPGTESRIGKREGFEIIAADLGDLDCSKLPTDVQAVITLGQSSHFRDFPGRSDDTYSVNVTANYKLFDWAAKNEVEKFVHVSSGGIYGGQLGEVLDETKPLSVDSPLGFYLGTKLCAEILFQNYRDFFKTAIILRPFFVYGPFQRKDMFIRRIIESVNTEKKIFLHGQNGLRVNPVYVSDMASAIIESLELSGHHILNVGGPDVLSLRELAEMVGELIGRKPVFEMTDQEPVDHVGSISQSLKKLKCEMTSFRVGLRKTLELEGLLG